MAIQGKHVIKLGKQKCPWVGTFLSNFFVFGSVFAFDTRMRENSLLAAVAVAGVDEGLQPN